MISFRDITDLEPITSIPDNADIVVVVDGVAKRISKENAKFGGGAVEKKVFYIGEQASSIDTLYKDAELTTLATAQEVYDAWAEGSLMLAYDNGNSTRYFTWCLFVWASGNIWNGDTTNVTYVGIADVRTDSNIHVGTAPSSGK